MLTLSILSEILDVSTSFVGGFTKYPLCCVFFFIIHTHCAQHIKTSAFSVILCNTDTCYFYAL